MLEIRRTDEFTRWINRLRDRAGRAKILVRIDRLAAGNAGDVRPIGDGLSELRIDHGPGYRVYFVRRGMVLVVLLCGGDKSSQGKDIAKAKEMATDLETWHDNEDPPI